MTITKLTSPFMLAAALLIAPACDSDEADPDTELRADVDADADADADVDAGDHAHHKRGRHNPAEHLCAEVACSDDQKTELEALFASAHEARKGGHEDMRATFEAKRGEMNTKLADAFRAETFDTSVLDHEPSEDMKARHLDFAAEMFVGVHGILNAEQRAQLADRIEEGGPGFLAMGRGHHGPKGKRGHHGKRGKHEGEGREGRAKKSPEERLAKHVEAFCEPISCTEDQKTQIGAAFEGAHEQRKDMAKPDLEPLADAFRAESVDVDSVKAILDSLGPDKAAHIEGFGNVIAEVHDILTPEQRSILADKIEAEGLRGVMGKGRHGKRGKRGRHGKRSE